MSMMPEYHFISLYAYDLSINTMKVITVYFPFYLIRLLVLQCKNGFSLHTSEGTELD